MRAMVLAAGLGTRLRPFTDDRPKALVEIEGRTLLEITLERLRRLGVREVIVNAHHFADMLIEYLRRHDFGMKIEVSHEPELLDTGGGLKKAAWFFLEQDSGEPFLVHNVDVLSSIDLARMIASHRQGGALATLAVQQRTSSRYLLLDAALQLCGRKSGDEAPALVRRVADPQPFAFCGIHVISPRLFALMSEEKAFSIITSYLRLARQGEKIAGFRVDEYYWRDVGTAEALHQAAQQRARWDIEAAAAPDGIISGGK
jgi:NDP-sugar pyrophosphorylase family protein